MTTATQNARPLPLYNCHKQVRALKIAKIEPEQLPAFTAPVCKGSFALGTACKACQRCHWEMEHGPSLGAMITPDEEGFAPFRVDGRYLMKHNPEVGGYFVQYADGYQSFSPGAAFEEGYTRADLNALELGAAVRAARLQGE